MKKTYAALLVITDRPVGAEPNLTTTEIARVLTNGLNLPAGVTVKIVAVEPTL